MRSRMIFFTLLLAAGAFALPLATHAAAIPWFGPIVPANCTAGFGMLVTVINNIIIVLLSIAIVFVAPLMIAYAGFLFVVNPTNPGGKEQAKNVLTNTIVGIVISLAAWMIVAAIMAVLYKDPSSGGSTWGTWEELMTSGGGGGECLSQAGSTAAAQPSGPGVTTAPIVRIGGLNQPPPGKAGTACDPSVIQKAAAASNYALTNTEANTLACIAQPESSCGAPNQVLNYKWDKGTGLANKGSTGAGAFQVLLSTNHKCYENYACYKAAGLANIASTGRLNCQQGFNNLGNPIKDSSGKPIPLVETCVRAAANLDCSITAAACLLRENNGSFSPWQADINSAKQTGCITK